MNSYFIYLPMDIIYMIIDYIDFDSIINLQTTLDISRKARILSYLAADLSAKHKALKDLYDINSSIHEIKIFVSYLKTQMHNQKILKREIDNLKLKVKTLPVY